MLRFVLLTITCFAATFALPQKRIANGDAASIQDHPYQVSINPYNSYRCSGVIIDAQWVLTTTHCLSFPPKEATVRSGTADLKGGKTHKIVKAVSHEHYVSQLSRFNDITLIKVEPAFEFDETTQPIKLVDAKVSITEGSKGVISGWGTHKSGAELPTFKAVTANIMSLSDCVDIYHSRFGRLLPGIICAKNERPGGAACSEIWSADDSGAPLVVDSKLAGVFSWGYLCDKPGFPSVFMEVAFFRDWIKRITGI